MLLVKAQWISHPRAGSESALMSIGFGVAPAELEGGGVSVALEDEWLVGGNGWAGALG